MSLKSLTIDTRNEILYRTPASDLSNICLTNTTIFELCNNEQFWAAYINHNYNVDYWLSDHYVKTVLGQLIPNKWELLLTSPYVPGVKNIILLAYLPMVKTYKNLALWMETAKLVNILVTKTFIDSQDIGIIPSDKVIGPYSGHDEIRKLAAAPNNYAYGEDLSVVNVRGRCIILPLSDRLEKSDLPMVQPNTLLKDITIKGRNLLDYIDTVIIHFNT
jgi:hypothetical protein